MKKIISILIALSLIVSGVMLAGCDGTGNGDDELPEYTLQFAALGGPTFFAATVAQFAADLEAATDGRVTVEMTWGYAPPLGYDYLMDQLYDAVFFNPVQCAPDLFPMASISTLPFSFPSAVNHTAAQWALWEAEYLDARLYDEMKVLWISGDQGSGLIMKSKNVTAPADLVGETLHVVPGMQQTIFETLGASTDPSIAAGEVSGALAAGTLTGNVKGYTPLPLFGWCDYAYSVTEPKLGSVCFVFAFNLDSWNALPAADRATIEGLIGDDNAYGVANAELMDTLTENGRQCLVTKGAHFVEWADIDGQVAPLLAGIWTDWIDARAALDGEAALHLFCEVLGQPAIGYTCP
jgi:TRAP-type C4-dicarboxylate transport system substrate-binding protein